MTKPRRLTPTQEHEIHRSTQAGATARQLAERFGVETVVIYRTLDRPDPGPTAADDTWRDDAACLGLDPNLFFPERGEQIENVRRICAGCPVAGPCLDYALTTGQKLGIWGGTSERERRRFRAHRRAKAVTA